MQPQRGELKVSFSGAKPHGPGQIPPNDGGIAAGQAAVAFEIASR